MTATLPTWSPRPFTGEPRTVLLTRIKADCLECICAGLDTAGMGRELLIARNTVKTHVRDVLAALDARDRLHAAVLVWSGQVRIELDTAPNEKSI